MDSIDNALTAILKLGLAAFGLTFDGSIGDLISNWLTSTWESIKGALRSVFESVGFDAPEMLQAGSAEQRAETAAAQGDIEAAEDEKEAAQRGMKRSGREEKFSGDAVFARPARVLLSPSQATRNLSFLEVSAAAVTLVFQLVVSLDWYGLV